MANALREDITGRFVVIKEEFFSADYRDIKYRVFEVTGGFGAVPFTRGSAVFGSTPYDGEKLRVDGRDDIERFATDEEIAAVGGTP